MTLKEAVIEILESAEKPLNVSEILSRIEERDIFAFGASGRRSVLLTCLKRHSINSHSCSPAREKAFRELDNGQFSLHQ